RSSHEWWALLSVPDVFKGPTDVFPHALADLSGPHGDNPAGSQGDDLSHLGLSACNALGHGFCIAHIKGRSVLEAGLFLQRLDQLLFVFTNLSVVGCDVAVWVSSERNVGKILDLFESRGDMRPSIPIVRFCSKAQLLDGDQVGSLVTTPLFTGVLVVGHDPP